MRLTPLMSPPVRGTQQSRGGQEMRESMKEKKTLAPSGLRGYGSLRDWVSRREGTGKNGVGITPLVKARE